jgi:CheY-like chemotaxis protein
MVENRPQRGHAADTFGPIAAKAATKMTNRGSNPESSAERGIGLALLQREVRRALHHLYDPVHLRRSLLPQLLGMAETLADPAALRQALIAAIGRLAPPPGTPVDSNSARIHQVLTYRFVEQSPQQQVAADMALSIRQLRRLEAAAAEVLAAVLAQRYQVDLAALVPPRLAAAEPYPPGVPASESGEMPDAEQELAWLQRSAVREPGNADRLLAAALATVQPLAQARRVTFDLQTAPDVPPLFAALPLLRQALINVLSALLDQVQGATILLDVRSTAGQVTVELRLEECAAIVPGQAGDSARSLALAQRLTEMAGGRFEGDAPALLDRGVQLVLPAAEQVSLLVVDDNEDALHLMERYVAGSQFRFLGTRDPEAALGVAMAQRPAVIVLDVMLPGVDGWELLGRLREHPDLGRTAFVISTILPQEPLALALGAAAFLQKPFTQNEFLAVLRRQASPPATTGR